MQLLVRKAWFRILIVTMGLIGITVVYPNLDSDKIREAVFKALQASSLLFSICTALSLSVLSNYVKGLNDASLKHINDTKNILEKLYSEYKDSDDKNIKQLLDEYVEPLLMARVSDWLAFEPIQPLFDKVEKPLKKLIKVYPEITVRFLMRVEDEINTLGILYIRRIASTLHAENIKGSMYLVCVGIVSIFGAAIVPHSLSMNYIVVLAAVAISIFAVLEILMLLSYIRQEAREEEPQSDD